MEEIFYSQISSLENFIFANDLQTIAYYSLCNLFQAQILSLLLLNLWNI